VAAHELIERARRHVRTKLRLTVSIARSAGQTLHTAALIAVGIRPQQLGRSR
jgi:hypothetical protein